MAQGFSLLVLFGLLFVFLGPLLVRTEMFQMRHPGPKPHTNRISRASDSECHAEACRPSSPSRSSDTTASTCQQSARQRPIFCEIVAKRPEQLSTILVHQIENGWMAEPRRVGSLRTWFSVLLAERKSFQTAHVQQPFPIPQIDVMLSQQGGGLPFKVTQRYFRAGQLRGGNC